LHKPTEKTVDVLLTDGFTRACLAVARSLSRRGVSFLVLCPTPGSMACYSRYVKNALPCPDPVSDPHAFIMTVLETIREYRIRLAIPITDHALLAFEQYRDELERHTTLAMASSRAVRNVLDKRANLEVAKQVAVPCPRQFRLTDIEQVPEAIKALGLPVVLKGRGNSIEPGAAQFKFKVLYANSEPELRDYVKKYCSHGEDPILQEYATGEVHNLCCFAAKGELLAVHEYHSIRRFNGSGVLRKIVAPLPDLVEHTRKLLASLEWDGLAHVAFFVSNDRKRTWYMETNGRFWASVQGSVHAGWDFPFWAYDYFLNGNQPSVPAIKLGSKTCYRLGDMLGFWKYVAGEGECPTTAKQHGKVRAFFDLLSGYRPGIHSDVFRWSDPLPAFMEAWPYFQRLIAAGGRLCIPKSNWRKSLFPKSPRVSPHG
jgi:predicted ATP-grasp superfamily ATP-dependent carboligase